MGLMVDFCLVFFSLRFPFVLSLLSSWSSLLTLPHTFVPVSIHISRFLCRVELVQTHTNIIHVTCGWTKLYKHVYDKMDSIFARILCIKMNATMLAIAANFKPLLAHYLMDPLSHIVCMRHVWIKWVHKSVICLLVCSFARTFGWVLLLLLLIEWQWVVYVSIIFIHLYFFVIIFFLLVQLHFTFRFEFPMSFPKLFVCWLVFVQKQIVIVDIYNEVSTHLRNATSTNITHLTQFDNITFLRTTTIVIVIIIVIVVICGRPHIECPDACTQTDSMCIWEGVKCHVKVYTLQKKK